MSRDEEKVNVGNQNRSGNWLQVFWIMWSDWSYIGKDCIITFQTVFCVLLYIKEIYIFQVIGFVFLFLKIKTVSMMGECSSCVSRAKSSMWPLILLIAAVKECETCRSAPWLNLSKRGKGMKTCCVASFKGERTKKNKKYWTQFEHNISK